MPRFVILTHDHPFLHWDLLLEKPESLRTWRLMEEPRNNLQIEATPLPDHRLAYLDYEGPVSRNRGVVKQWDRGEYEIIPEKDSVILFTMKGEKLNGVARIIEEDGKEYFVLE